MLHIIGIPLILWLLILVIFRYIYKFKPLDQIHLHVQNDTGKMTLATGAIWHTHIYVRGYTYMHSVVMMPSQEGVPPRGLILVCTKSSILLIVAKISNHE